ncbi:MAG: NAD kinase [Flavobacteriales bacterium]|nr:NAD kinase [Flavobacteriales bacterium]
MKIVVYGQELTDGTREVLNDVVVFFKKHNTQISVTENLFANLSEEEKEGLQVFPINTRLDPTFSYLISIGGDGTVLRSTTIVADSGVPILAINTGRLGFLADTQADTINQSLTQLLNNEFTISSRILLELTCDPPNDTFGGCNYAMNEVTVSRKDTASMITIETRLNGEYLNSYWADGLIVSTPTGSTGYSLSCGGPVLIPEVSSLVINPIAPHNLNARPMVVPDSTVVQLRVSGREKQYLVSLDSRISVIDQDTVLTIKKNSFEIKMVELKDASFLKTLRKKLLWGEDKRN